MTEENETNESWQAVADDNVTTTPEPVLLNTENSDEQTTDPVDSSTVTESEVSNTEIESDLEEEITDDEALRILLSERYGQEFESIDAFDSYIQTDEQEEQPQFEYASETLKQLDEYVRSTGRTVEDYLTTQRLNPDEMSNEDAVLFSLKRENPGMNESDLKFYMEQTYKMSTDKESTDYRFGQIALQKEAIKAKNTINEFKEHYKSPVEDRAISQQADKEIAENRESFFNDVVEDMQEIEGLTFDIDDKGTEFTFKIDESMRPDPQEHTNNIENFFNQYVDEEGTWNYDALNTDMFILNNIDSIIKSVANHYKSQGTEEVVQELKNPSFEGKQTQGNNDGPKTMAQQIFNAMREQGDL